MYSEVSDSPAVSGRARYVVIVYPHIEAYGGIERNIVALAGQIALAGLVPVVVTFHDGIGMDTFHSELKVVQLPSHWSPFVKGSRLKEWLVQNEDKMVGMPLMMGCRAGFYAAAGGSRSYCLHYTDPPSLLAPTRKARWSFRNCLPFKQRFGAWMTARGVEGAEVRLTMTRRNAIELEDLYGRAFDVLYQGGVGGTPRRRARARCSGKTLRIFSICRINESKNLHWIVDWAANVKGKAAFEAAFGKIEVVIAGEGPDRASLEQLIRNADLEGMVRMPGFLTAKEVEDEYDAADIFVVPGRQGYGLPVLEALYRGVPVVMNRESRVSEILEENPWVKVCNDGPAAFERGLEDHIWSVRANLPDTHWIQELPTEEKWAVRIGEACSWWTNVTEARMSLAQ